MRQVSRTVAGRPWQGLVQAAAIAVLLPAIAGCSAVDRTEGRGKVGAPLEAAFQQAPAAAPPEVGASGLSDAARSRSVVTESQERPSQGQVSPSRKVIRNGSMRLEVPALDAALERLKVILADTGGHIASESRSQDAGQGRQATLTCRVPAERLDDIVGRLRDLGREEMVELSSDDITEQYFDLEVRLRTQQQLEARLRQLLERSSNNLGDLLAIEREVARVRTEIDQLEGRKRLWDQQVALSTLVVMVHEPRPIGGTDEGGVWRTLKRAFRESADNFVESVAGVIAATGGLIPVVAALVLAAWVIRAIWRRSRRTRVTAD